ncbi:MAG: XRE family transcriptional regulator [Legionellales bacterium]|nr:XRE family transcriptional regulator [Legionellales bacterium]|tara:strand:- start:73114 stop:73350 length:237 start_codon:yes stop_codon:yes gene_type:complete
MHKLQQVAVYYYTQILLEIKKSLSRYRLRENLNQQDFAEQINITQPELSKMETGKRPIGKTVAKRIAKAFGVNYQIFL